jgi:hypothetical protein
MLGRKLLLLCANPDEVHSWVRTSSARVPRGGLCRNGRVGAPRTHLRAIHGALVPRERVVVIGDSGRTDIGVNGFDALFVTSGIHAQELGGPPSLLQAS